VKVSSDMWALPGDVDWGSVPRRDGQRDVGRLVTVVGRVPAPVRIDQYVNAASSAAAVTANASQSM